MSRPNYVALQLRALSAASAASFIAITQSLHGSAYLAEKARALATRRRAEADFYGSLPFIA